MVNYNFLEKLMFGGSLVSFLFFCLAFFGLFPFLNIPTWGKFLALGLLLPQAVIFFFLHVYFLRRREQDPERFQEKIFLSLSRVFTLNALVLIGIKLSVHKGVCTAESCHVVDTFSPGEELLIFSFSYLLLLFFLTFKTVSSDGRAELFFVIPGFCGAFVFLARQVVDYQALCHFCIPVDLSLIGATAPLILLWGRQALLEKVSLAVCGFLAAFIATGLWLKPLNQKDLKPLLISPESKKIAILIYEEDCPHCHHVIDFCKKEREKIKGLSVYLCEQKEAAALLRLLDIPGVPVLVVEDTNEKEVLVGEGSILAYLKEITNSHPQEKEDKSILSPQDLLPPVWDGGVCTPEGCGS